MPGYGSTPATSAAGAWAATAPAQWINYPTPGIPRLPNGKPDLAAPAPRTARGYVRQSLAGFSNLLAAQTDARTRAADDAKETACAAVDENEKLDGVDLTGVTFDCRPSPLGGTVCAADYVATCRLEARQPTCG